MTAHCKPVEATTSEMVERMARAICYSYCSRICGPGEHIASREIPWRGDGGHKEEYVERHWREWRNEAMFALSAAREPTEAMVDAADHDDYDPRYIWQIMIDEALQ